MRGSFAVTLSVLVAVGGFSVGADEIKETIRASGVVVAARPATSTAGVVGVHRATGRGPSLSKQSDYSLLGGNNPITASSAGSTPLRSAIYSSASSAGLFESTSSSSRRTSPAPSVSLPVLSSPTRTQKTAGGSASAKENSLMLAGGAARAPRKVEMISTAISVNKMNTGGSGTGSGGGQTQTVPVSSNPSIPAASATTSGSSSPIPSPASTTTPGSSSSILSPASTTTPGSSSSIPSRTASTPTTDSTGGRLSSWTQPQRPRPPRVSSSSATVLVPATGRGGGGSPPLLLPRRATRTGSPATVIVARKTSEEEEWSEESQHHAVAVRPKSVASSSTAGRDDATKSVGSSSTAGRDDHDATTRGDSGASSSHSLVSSEAEAGRKKSSDVKMKSSASKSDEEDDEEGSSKVGSSKSSKKKTGQSEEEPLAAESSLFGRVSSSASSGSRGAAGYPPPPRLAPSSASAGSRAPSAGETAAEKDTKERVPRGGQDDHDVDDERDGTGPTTPRGENNGPPRSKQAEAREQKRGEEQKTSSNDRTTAVRKPPAATKVPGKQEANDYSDEDEVPLPSSRGRAPEGTPVTSPKKREPLGEDDIDEGGPPVGGGVEETTSRMSAAAAGQGAGQGGEHHHEPSATMLSSGSELGSDHSGSRAGAEQKRTDVMTTSKEREDRDHGGPHDEEDKIGEGGEDVASVSPKKKSAAASISVGLSDHSAKPARSKKSPTKKSKPVDDGSAGDESSPDPSSADLDATAEALPTSTAQRDRHDEHGATASSEDAMGKDPTGKDPRAKDPRAKDPTGKAASLSAAVSDHSVKPAKSKKTVPSSDEDDEHGAPSSSEDATGKDATGRDATGKARSRPLDEKGGEENTRPQGRGDEDSENTRPLGRGDDDSDVAKNQHLRPKKKSSTASISASDVLVSDPKTAQRGGRHEDYTARPSGLAIDSRVERDETGRSHDSSHDDSAETTSPTQLHSSSSSTLSSHTETKKSSAAETKKSSVGGRAVAWDNLGGKSASAEKKAADHGEEDAVDQDVAEPQSVKNSSSEQSQRVPSSSSSSSSSEDHEADPEQDM